jgi:hypothetical protein
MCACEGLMRFVGMSIDIFYGEVLSESFDAIIYWYMIEGQSDLCWISKVKFVVCSRRIWLSTGKILLVC